MFKKIIKYLKRDSFLLGIILGIVFPAIIYGILHLLNVSFPNPSSKVPFLKESTVQILGIAVNALLLRYYLINLKSDKTGRGIMLVTFILAILFFALNLTK